MDPIPIISSKIRKQFHQPWFGGGVGAVLAALLGVGLLLLPLGKGLRDWSYDLPFLLKPEKLVEDVAIVYLDQPTFDTLHETPGDFDRAWHTKLVKRLQADGAKLAVFDILFIDDKRPITDVDREFAAAMRGFGRVVIGGELQEDRHLGIRGKTVTPPIDLFRDAAAGWGLAKVHRDTDFSARHHHPGTEQIPSLAWRAAELVGAEVTKHPESRDKARWLNYYAPEPFQNISYVAALRGEPLPPSFTFSNKVVFVGAGEIAGYTGEEKEQYRYPWSWLTGHFPVGVQLHALTFSNLTRQDWLRRLPGAVESLLLVVLGAAFGYGLSFFRPLAATGLTILASLIVAGASILAFAQLNVWFPWLIVVVAQAPVALFWAYLFHSIKSYVATQLLETSLALYLSPVQVKRILKQPELLKPGAEQKTVSILFSDIANFSKISERKDAADLVQLLNRYYETAIACVHETDGTVMNIIGDAIFAIWNAPEAQPDHSERAARAAVLLNEKLFHFDAASSDLPLRTRVGLHTGVVCVGNIGSSTHFDFTAIGESVNLASRLEGLNKQLGTNILATRDIQKSAVDGLVSRVVGHFRFKGFDQVVEVHEFIGAKESEEKTRPWRESFASALCFFQRGALTKAEAGFRRTLELRDDDGPSKFYLARLAELQARPLPAEWMGEIDLREK
jgi:adenylate cyclase